MNEDPKLLLPKSNVWENLQERILSFASVAASVESDVSAEVVLKSTLHGILKDLSQLRDQCDQFQSEAGKVAQSVPRTRLYTPSGVGKDAEVQQLERKLVSRRQALERQNDEVAEARRRVTEAWLERDNVQNRLDLSREEQEHSRKRHKQQYDDMMKKTERYESELKAVQEENDREVETCKAQSRAIVVKEEELSKVQRQQDALEKDLAETIARVDEMASLLQQSARGNRAHARESMLSRIQASRKELHRLSAQNAELQTLQNSKDSRRLIARLEHEKRELEKQKMTRLNAHGDGEVDSETLCRVLAEEYHQAALDSARAEESLRLAEAEGADQRSAVQRTLTEVATKAKKLFAQVDSLELEKTRMERKCAQLQTRQADLQNMLIQGEGGRQRVLQLQITDVLASTEVMESQVSDQSMKINKNEAVLQNIRIQLEAISSVCGAKGSSSVARPAQLSDLSPERSSKSVPAPSASTATGGGDSFLERSADTPLNARLGSLAQQIEELTLRHDEIAKEVSIATALKEKDAVPQSPQPLTPQQPRDPIADLLQNSRSCLDRFKSLPIGREGVGNGLANDLSPVPRMKSATASLSRSASEVGMQNGLTPARMQSASPFLLRTSSEFAISTVDAEAVPLSTMQSQIMASPRSTPIMPQFAQQSNMMTMGQGNVPQQSPRSPLTGQVFPKSQNQLQGLPGQSKAQVPATHPTQRAPSAQQNLQQPAAWQTPQQPQKVPLTQPHGYPGRQPPPSGYMQSPAHPGAAMQSARMPAPGQIRRMG